MTKTDVRAIEAGLELDQRMAVEVMQWSDGFGSAFKKNWSPSTDIKAAWDVVTEIGLLDSRTLEHAEGEWWIDDNYAHRVQTSAPTVELCICRAALLAVQERQVQP